MAFQVNSQTLFLTYSQINVDFPDFVHTIFDHACTTNCDGYAIGRESHEDGGTHYHVLLHYSAAVRTRNSRFFDLTFDNVGYHPNIQSVKSLRHAYDYVTKDGNVFEDLGAIASRLQRSGTTWRDALSAESYEEACSIVESHYPRDWILYGDRIRNNLRHTFPTITQAVLPAAYDTASFTNVPQQLTDWVRDELHGNHDRKKSLILYGESRTGKTCWARSLGPHLYQFGRLDPALCLNKMDEQFVIFDDFPDNFDNQLSCSWKSFLGCQAALTLRELYRPPKMVNWSIPCIWICNKLPTFPDNDFITVNAIFVRINSRLY